MGVAALFRLIRATAQGVSFAVRLTPKGGRDRIEGWVRTAGEEGHLKIRVSAPPEKGKANDALVALLSRTLGVGKSRIAIAKGQAARNKIVEIAGDAAELAARLKALGDDR